MLISCTSKSIKISEFSKINQQNEYVNNYITYSEKSRDKKILEFFFNSILIHQKIKISLEKLIKIFIKMMLHFLRGAAIQLFCYKK